jgi:heme oxygenase (biliverdin-IX-beta and delta-forming)
VKDCNVIRMMLRARTAALHAHLDRVVNSSRVGEAPRLGRLLAIHYDALMLLVPALERAGAKRVYPGWEGRSRLAALEEDLRLLGVRPHRARGHRPSFTKEPALWGALYALEGSRLGNRIILDSVMECGCEDERRATQFLSHGLEERSAWGKFVAQLDDLHYRGEAFEWASLGAERVFETYLNSAKRYPGSDDPT